MLYKLSIVHVCMLVFFVYIAPLFEEKSSGGHFSPMHSTSLSWQLGEFIVQCPQTQFRILVFGRTSLSVCSRQLYRIPDDRLMVDICRTCQMTFDWTMLDISKSTARRVAVTYARKILCTNTRSAIGGFMLTVLAKCVLSCITQSDRYYMYIANVPLKEHVCFRI